MFYPGEIEYLREQKRRRDGIEIEDATWKNCARWPANTSSPAELGLA